MPEKQRATLIDVAKAAGVHFATASRALDSTKAHLVNVTTRKKIQKVALELGYRANIAARGLRTGRSATIGFIVADLGNPFLPPILRSAEETFDAEGYSVVISETRDDPSELSAAILKLRTRDVDGLVISSARFGDEELIRETAAAVPTVLAIRHVNASDVISVGHDDVLGGEIAANHLTDLGHHKVAQLQGPNDISSFRGRSQGFHQVAEAKALEDLTSNKRYFPPTIEGGAMAARLLLEKDVLPSGIFAHNDLMAIGAIEEFESRNLRCPGDISVVGYNNSPLTDRLSPSLTTIELPGGSVGSLAASRLLDLIYKREVAQGTKPLAPRLIQRDSTANLT